MKYIDEFGLHHQAMLEVGGERLAFTTPAQSRLIEIILKEARARRSFSLKTNEAKNLSSRKAMTFAANHQNPLDLMAGRMLEEHRELTGKEN
jgi:hypothetical protein